MASDADDHVDPHSSANWTIDLVSSNMKPAPRKKNCQPNRPPARHPPDARSATMMAIAEMASTAPRAVM